MNLSDTLLEHLVVLQVAESDHAHLGVVLSCPQDVQEVEQLEYQLQRENEATRQQIAKAIADRYDATSTSS